MKLISFITFIIVAFAMFVSSEAKCPDICLTVYQPVCAKDDKGNKKNFGNNCELTVEQCQHPERGYVFYKDGRC